MNMATHRKATRGLAAENRIDFVDLCGNVFKPDRNFVTGFAERFRYAIQQVRSRQVAHNRPFPPLILMQIIIEQNQYFVCADVLTGTIDDAEPVSVTIDCNTEIVTALYDKRRATRGRVRAELNFIRKDSSVFPTECASAIF